MDIEYTKMVELLSGQGIYNHKIVFEVYDGDELVTSTACSTDVVVYIIPDAVIDHCGVVTSYTHVVVF